jgi:hypothetical protein
MPVPPAFAGQRILLGTVVQLNGNSPYRDRNMEQIPDQETLFIPDPFYFSGCSNEAGEEGYTFEWRITSGSCPQC